MTRKVHKTAFETVTSHLGQLSRSELEELAVIVGALLDATKEEEDDQVEDGDVASDTKSGARGHIEAKMINGYGPYLYLRYWSGGHLRSKYIGKAKGES